MKNFKKSLLMMGLALGLVNMPAKADYKNAIKMLREANSEFRLDKLVNMPAQANDKSEQVISTQASTAYLEIRDQFKRVMYQRQGGLMGKEAYLKFVEPFLQKAETELKILKHFQSKSEFTAQDKQYLSALLDLNVAIFNGCHASEKDKIIRNLYQIIEIISTVDGLKLNIGQEVSRTEKMLREANSEFRQAAMIGCISNLWANRAVAP